MRVIVVGIIVLCQTIATIWLTTSYILKAMPPCQSSTDLPVTTGHLTQEFSAVTRINTAHVFHKKQTCLTCKTCGEVLYVKKIQDSFV